MAKVRANAFPRSGPIRRYRRPERPSILEIPEWNDPKWRCTHASFEIRANYGRIVEELEPALPSEGPLGDLSVRADAIQVRYREHLRIEILRP